jgi:hypothetical protein
VVSLWVVNASPIILLAKVGLRELLRHLGAPVVVPEAARMGADMGGNWQSGCDELKQSG